MADIQEIGTLLQLLLVYMYSHAVVSSALHSNCTTTIIIDSRAQLDPTCTRTSSSQLTICGDLQQALDFIRDLDISPRTSNFTNNPLEECVSLLIPNRKDHYITAPLFLGDISIHFVGMLETDILNNRAGINASNLPLPSIICDYVVDVELDRIFDLDYDYTDYLFYARHSRAISFLNIQFANCPYPIRINSVDQVTIHNSLFRNFSEAVFDMFNNHNISITSSTFYDNQGTGISRYRFRGNTGAVAIGFDGIFPNYSQPQVLITNCNFTRNRATATALFRTSSGAFFNRAFTGRGGAVGVFFNEDVHNISITITDNLFYSNYARSFGGAVFLAIFNEGIQHKIELNRNEFNSNIGELGGGAIQMSFVSNGIPGKPHTASFIDCLFQNNSGASGGAVYVFPAFQGGDGNLAIFRNCHFLMNRGLTEGFGVAVAISSSIFFRNTESLPRHDFTNCTFEGNYGTNGVVSIAYTPATFNGYTVFKNNTGTSALRIVGSLVEFYGSLMFIHNYVEDVAALHILSLGQIRLTSDLSIEFIGNSGRYGASILVETSDTLTAFQNLAYNPQCFVLNQMPNLPPPYWDDVSVKFRRNSAVLGSSIYMSNVDSCSWFSLKPPFFDPFFLKQWPIWDFSNDSRNTGFEDPYSLNYHVETQAVAIDSENDSVTLWPGHKFQLQLTGWDQFNHPTFISARFFAETDRESDMVNLHPPLVITDSSIQSSGHLSNQYTLTYAVSGNIPLDTNHKPVANVRIDVPFNDIRRVTTDSFVIYPDVCPVGYALRNSTTQSGLECSCKEDVYQILNCEDDQDTILIQSGHWGAPYTNISQYNQDLNHFYLCPAGYCRCSQETSLGPTMCVHTYTISQPDAQCACKRRGVLCGECEINYGVSALLDNCVTCSDAFGLLIAVLIIVDALLFVMITLWDKPFPSVFYPFVFYLQAAPLIGRYFPSSFEIVGKYLVFVGSTLSFYFPYDFCLHGSMSPLVAYFLRYVPILIAMVMSPLLIILRKTRYRVLDHHGLWWIVLFLYTPVVHTSVSVLNCHYIDTVGEYFGTSSYSMSIMWFVDGSVQCFSGWHAPLGVFALLMLLMCAAVIPLIVIIVLQKYPKRAFYWLRTISAPLTESYKKEYLWWFAVELGRRLFLFVLFVPLPTTYAIPLHTVCVLLAVYGLFQPYKSQLINLLEIVVLSNFLFLLMLHSTQSIKDALFVFPILDSSDMGNLTTTDVCHDQLYSGVALFTWLLLPFYYLPLFGFLIVIVVMIFNYLRTKVMMHKESIGSSEIELERINSGYVTPDSEVRSVSVRIGNRRGTHGVAIARSRNLQLRRNIAAPLLEEQPTLHEVTTPVFSPTSSTMFFNTQGVHVSDC